MNSLKTNTSNSGSFRILSNFWRIPSSPGGSFGVNTETSTSGVYQFLRAASCPTGGANVFMGFVPVDSSLNRWQSTNPTEVINGLAFALPTDSWKVETVPLLHQFIESPEPAPNTAGIQRIVFPALITGENILDWPVDIFVEEDLYYLRLWIKPRDSPGDYKDAWGKYQGVVLYRNNSDARLLDLSFQGPGGGHYVTRKEPGTIRTALTLLRNRDITRDTSQFLLFLRSD